METNAVPAPPTRACPISRRPKSAGNQFVSKLLQQANARRQLRSRGNDGGFGPWTLPHDERRDNGQWHSFASTKRTHVGELDRTTDVHECDMEFRTVFTDGTDTIKVAISVRECDTFTADAPQPQNVRKRQKKIAEHIPPTRSARTRSPTQTNRGRFKHAKESKVDMFFRSVLSQESKQPSRPSSRGIAKGRPASASPLGSKNKAQYLLNPRKLRGVNQKTISPAGISGAAVGIFSPIATTRIHIKKTVVPDTLAGRSRILRSLRKPSPRRFSSRPAKLTLRHILETVLTGLWDGESRICKHDPWFENWGITKFRFDLDKAVPGEDGEDRPVQKVCGQVYGEGTSNGQMYKVEGHWSWGWAPEDSGACFTPNDRKVLLEKTSTVNESFILDTPSTSPPSTIYYGDISFDAADSTFFVKGMYEYGSFMLKKRVPKHMLGALQQFL